MIMRLKSIEELKSEFEIDECYNNKGFYIPLQDINISKEMVEFFDKTHKVIITEWSDNYFYIIDDKYNFNYHKDWFEHVDFIKEREFIL